MTCTCPKPSLHDRVLRAISIRNAEEYSDIVTAAARLLVSAHESDVAEGVVSVDDDEADEYCLLVADIDNETCGRPSDDAIALLKNDPMEKAEISALRSAIETVRSMGQENLAEDLENLLAQMEEDSPGFEIPTMGQARQYFAERFTKG